MPERLDQDEQEALTVYLTAKRDADRANAAVIVAEQVLLKQMADRQRKTLAMSVGGKRFTATYTQRSTNQINEDGLRKALGAQVFDKFTVRKLDRKALEQAMTEGEIDPVVVARYVEQVPGKSYITYREKEETVEA